MKRKKGMGCMKGEEREVAVNKYLGCMWKIGRERERERRRRDR